MLLGYLFSAFAAACCVLAWFKGGAPERVGGVAIAAAWVFVTAAQSLTRDQTPTLFIMFSDFALATTFLVLALKYSSLWLGAAMLFQGADLAVHAAFMTDVAGHSRAHVYWLDAMSLLILLSVLGGTLAAWRRRAEAQRDERPPLGLRPSR